MFNFESSSRVFHTLKDYDRKRDKIVDLCIFCIYAVLTISYIIEYIKGNRTLDYLRDFFSVLWFPYIITHTYLKWTIKKGIFNVNIYRFSVIMSYVGFYCFAVITTIVGDTWCYIFPLVSILVLYFNKIFIISSFIPVLMINISLFVVRQDFSNTSVVEFEQRMACFILCMAFMVCSCGVLDNYYSYVRRLYSESNIDPITGLHNENGIRADLERYFAATVDTLVSMIVLKVDNSDDLLDKTDNRDAYTTLLVHIGKTILDVFDDSDNFDSQVYKVGADEFVIVVKDCSRFDVQDAAKILQKKLKGIIVSRSDEKKGILRCSIGITDSDAVSQKNFESMMNSCRYAVERARSSEGIAVELDRAMEGVKKSDT